MSSCRIPLQQKAAPSKTPYPGVEPGNTVFRKDSSASGRQGKFYCASLMKLTLEN
ncbi:hypothetical protein [Aerosakkonema sp. BLCC-F183]|uniref:hypothetical protein n=1 Tax=Aerosakkonema sp. BLCC-F183 TaxID=3342834 RepID=UPI0035BC61D3